MAESEPGAAVGPSGTHRLEGGADTVRDLLGGAGALAVAKVLEGTVDALVCAVSVDVRRGWPAVACAALTEGILLAGGTRGGTRGDTSGGSSTAGGGGGAGSGGVGGASGGTAAESALSLVEEVHVFRCWGRSEGSESRGRVGRGRRGGRKT